MNDAHNASCYVIKQDPDDRAGDDYVLRLARQLAARKQDRARHHPQARRRRRNVLQSDDVRDRTLEQQAIPYGIKIYVPFLKQYFIREDLCAASGPPTGSGSNGCYKLWFDLWVGGNGEVEGACGRQAASASSRRSGRWTVILYPRERHAGRTSRTDLSQPTAAQRLLRRQTGKSLLDA